MLSIGTSFGDSVLNGNNAKKSLHFMKGVDIYGFDYLCTASDDSLEHY